MKFSNILPIAVLGIVLALGVGAVITKFTGPSERPPANDPVIPTFSAVAVAGLQVYEDNCGKCHGVSGIGTNSGPPLIHQIYNPGHHPDVSFRNAVERGVQQHHWRFGSMPSQSQVTNDQIRQLTRYVRELQQANGIAYEKHSM